MKRFLIFLALICFLTETNAKTIHWNKGRGYESFKYNSPEGIFLDNATDTLIYDYFSLDSGKSKKLELKFRAKNFSADPLKKNSYYNKEGKKFNESSPHWGFFITGEKDTVIFSIKRTEKILATESEPCMEISIHDMASKELEKCEITDGVTPFSGDNLWNLKVSNNTIELKFGNRNLSRQLDYLFVEPVTGFGFFAAWGAKVLISDIMLDYEADCKRSFSYDLNEINKQLETSTDEMEGHWLIFDRDLEESLLKLGGDYELVSLKEGEDYIFLYKSGASVNKENWMPGDIKLVLHPTPFEDIFQVEWTDSMKETLTRDIKAQRGEGETLTFQFPYQSSKIRLRKIP